MLVQGIIYNDTTLKVFTFKWDRMQVILGIYCFVLYAETGFDYGKHYQPAAFSHKDEDASAGYYSVVLKEEGIKAELTVTAPRRYAPLYVSFRQKSIYYYRFDSFA